MVTTSGDKDLGLDGATKPAGNGTHRAWQCGTTPKINQPAYLAVRSRLPMQSTNGKRVERLGRCEQPALHTLLRHRTKRMRTESIIRQCGDRFRGHGNGNIMQMVPGRYDEQNPVPPR